MTKYCVKYVCLHAGAECSEQQANLTCTSGCLLQEVASDSYKYTRGTCVYLADHACFLPVANVETSCAEGRVFVVDAARILRRVRWRKVTEDWAGCIGDILHRPCSNSRFFTKYTTPD